MKTILLVAGVFYASCLWIDSALAQAWQWNSINTNVQSGFWGAIATSADGKVLYLAHYDDGVIYTSTNSGNTWISNSSPSAFWPFLAASADGSKLFEVWENDCGHVYTTTNGGLNWTTNSIAGLIVNSSNSVWSTIATSADGTKWVVATATNWVYVSSDSGMTWTSNSLPNLTLQPLLLRCSADGTKLVVAGTLGSIWVSTNAGAAWTAPVNAPSAGWQAIASSADGSKVFLVGTTNLIYRSTDYGFTWQSNSVSGVTVWSGIASSADGIKLAAVAPSASFPNGSPGVGVFVSINAGITWALDTNQQIIPAFPNFEELIGLQLDIVSSADGAKLVLIPGIEYVPEDGGITGLARDDDIWTSYTPPAPQVEISAPGINLVLSWTVPATNVVLQQNGDITMTNWTTMTNAATLNYSNLQYEAGFSPANGSSFFRLATP
jgi:photosystem II stability/assembly factor-like uncharacterized protein